MFWETLRIFHLKGFTILEKKIQKKYFFLFFCKKSYFKCFFMTSSKIFTKKIINDVLATLIASNLLSSFTVYHLGNQEVKSGMYWIAFVIYMLIFLSGLILLRKTKPQKKNIWDLVFPIFLLSSAFLLLGFAISLGDIYDENFGKKLLDSIDSDFMRMMIDIYASGANATLLLKPLGLFCVLSTTLLPRFLGALSGHPKAKQ